MDIKFYSEKSVRTFVKKTLCQNDSVLYKYYQDDEYQKFRARISRLYKDKDSDFETVIQTYITDATRDIIRETIGDIGKYMRPMGDLIIAGGEAFNSYFYRDSRIITTDIDTKFTPIFKTSDGKILSKNSPFFFGYLQVAKLLLWDYLGKIVVRLNNVIHDRINNIIMKTKVAKIFNISFGDGPWLSRRYTLIKKMKQSQSNNVVEKDVLVDIELFAIDLKLKYFLPSDGKVRTRNIGGLLDIAFMRPSEVGFESTYTREQGMYIRNIITNKVTYNKDILIAGKKFLVEDLYLMQSLGLRPQKKNKDKTRMFIFCKDVLKIPNIRTDDSIEKIFLKSIPKIQEKKNVHLMRRPVFTKVYVSRALKVDPNKYQKYTTDVKQSKILYQLVLGLKGAKGQNIPGYAPSMSNYRFNFRTKKWVQNESSEYIKNEATYILKPTKKVPKAPKVQLKNMLYGYRANRNSWMPSRLVNKAAMIPIVGLKNKSFIVS